MNKPRTDPKQTNDRVYVEQLSNKALNNSPLMLEAFRNAMQGFILLVLASGQDNVGSRKRDESA